MLEHLEEYVALSREWGSLPPEGEKAIAVQVREMEQSAAFKYVRYLLLRRAMGHVARAASTAAEAKPAEFSARAEEAFRAADAAQSYSRSVLDREKPEPRKSHFR